MAAARRRKSGVFIVVVFVFLSIFCFYSLSYHIIFNLKSHSRHHNIMFPSFNGDDGGDEHYWRIFIIIIITLAPVPVSISFIKNKYSHTSSAERISYCIYKLVVKIKYAAKEFFLYHSLQFLFIFLLVYKRNVITIFYNKKTVL